MSSEIKIAELLSRWEECRRSKIVVSPEQLCLEAPELLGPLREKIQALQAMSRVLRKTADADGAVNQALLGDQQETFAFRAGMSPVTGYVLESPLGRGGFGQVWKATGPDGVSVALKFVNLAGNLGKGELRALETVKHLRHPNILPLFGAWTHNDFLIMAMELGEDTLFDVFLRARAQNLPGIPRETLLKFLANAASGLDYLNSPNHMIGEKRGVAVQHRDIKPQNILLVGGSAKLADFGLMRILENTFTSHTGSMTLSYAPPEFFRGRTTLTSDQYSLAATYCHLRSGRPPFCGTPGQIMEGHLRRNPDLSSIPEYERPIISRALAKGPEFRWSSCGEFVNQLALVSHVGEITPRVAALGIPELGGKRQAPHVIAPSLTKKRPLFQLLCVSICVFGFTTILAWLFLNARNSPKKLTEQTGMKVQDSKSSKVESVVKPPAAITPATKMTKLTPENDPKKANPINESVVNPSAEPFPPTTAKEVTLEATLARLVKKGVDLWNRGQYKQARDVFSEAIRIDPTLAVAFKNRGAVRHHLNDFRGEIEDCSDAIRLANPNDHDLLAASYYHRGEGYRRKGDPSKAVQDFTKAIEYKPDYGVAYWQRAIAEKDRRNIGRSNQDREMAKKLGYQPPASALK